MSNDSDGSGCALAIFIAIIFAVATFYIGARSGKDHGYHLHQREAVEAKHADWIANPDGTTTFQWKPL